jgi:hypothetical protein
VQCTDDSNGARSGIDSSGEGRLLWGLQDGLFFNLSAVRSLRVWEDRPNCLIDLRAMGPRSRSGARIGRIAVRLLRASI